MNYFKLPFVFSFLLFSALISCKTDCYNCTKVKMCLICETANGKEAVECETEGYTSEMYDKLNTRYYIKYSQYKCTVAPNGIVEKSYCENKGSDFAEYEYRCIPK